MRLAMATALSRSSATATRPKRESRMPAYFSSHWHSREAMPTKPGRSSISRWSSTAPRMVVRGRKVARPRSRCCSSRMAALASCSVSTTMFCMAPPRAVSRATAYSFGVLSSWVTGPHTPRRMPRPASFITAFTLWAKPSRLRSRSSKSLARRCCSLASRVSWSSCSLAAWARFCRDSSRSSWPLTAFSRPAMAVWVSWSIWASSSPSARAAAWRSWAWATLPSTAPARRRISAMVDWAEVSWMRSSARAAPSSARAAAASSRRRVASSAPLRSSSRRWLKDRSLSRLSASCCSLAAISSRFWAISRSVSSPDRRAAAACSSRRALSWALWARSFCSRPTSPSARTACSSKAAAWLRASSIWAVQRLVSR